MSREIEERIVEMRFENRNFEKNVAETIDSLSKLDKNLNEMDRSKTFEALDVAAKKVDLTPVSGAVDKLKDGFSALETIATGALMKIGSNAVDLGSKLLDSLSSMSAMNPSNIMAGWSKFGEKTTSVATLVSQGYDLDIVNEQLERLNWYTDETSYNFTDMIANIAKFTAAGQGLEDSVTAMEGIANWAALSGQNATVASRAMYQLAQAMGRSMQKADWVSVMNANMDTQEFRQHALDAAVALGTLRKNADETYTSLVGKVDDFNIDGFIDSLTKGAWLTPEVQMAVYKDYANAVDQIYEYATEHGITASQAIEELGDSIDEFGKKAFESGQEARTWVDVLGSVKDAVSTGWMNTFENIIGDYKQAKTLYTDLANEFYTIFAEGGNIRNEKLSIWKEMGGRDLLFANDEETGDYGALWNIIYGLEDAADTVRAAYGDIFVPDTPEEAGKALYELTKRFKELTKQFQMSDETAEKLRSTFGGLFAILDIGKQAFQAVFNGIKNVVSALSGSKGSILDVTAKWGEYFKALDKSIKENQTFEKAVSKIGDVLKAILTPIANVVKKFTEMSTSLKPLPELLKEALGEERYERGAEALATIGEKLKEMFRGIGEELGRLGEGIKEQFLQIAANIMGIEGAGDTLDTLKGKFRDVGGALADWVLARLEELAAFDYTIITNAVHTAVDFVLARLGDLQNAAGWIEQRFGTVFSAIGSYIRSAIPSLIKGVGEAFDYIQNHGLWAFLRNVWEEVQGIWQRVVDAWNGDLPEDDKLGVVMQAIRSALQATIPWIESFTGVLKNLFNELTPGKVLVIGFGIVFASVALSIKDGLDSITESIKGATGLFKALTNKISKPMSPLKDLATAIGALTASLVVLSDVNPEGLDRAVGAIWSMAGVMAALGGGSSAVSKFLLDENAAKSLKTMAATFQSIGVAMIELSGALWVLSNVDTENIYNQLGAMAVMLTEFVVVAIALGAKMPKETNFNGMVALAGAMVVVAFTLDKLSTVDTEGIYRNLLPFGVIIGLLDSLALSAKGIKFSNGMGLLVMCFDLLAIVGVMKKLADEPVADIVAALPQYLVALGLLGGLAVAARLAGEKAGKAGVGMLGMALSLEVMLDVVRKLGEMPLEIVLQGGAVASALLVVMGIVSRLASGGLKLTNGAGLMLMATALDLLLPAVWALGKMDTETVVQGGLAVAALLTVFGIVVKMSSLEAGAKSATGAIVAMIAALGMITVAIGILTLLPGDEVLTAAGSLSAVLLALGGAMKLAQDTDWKSMVPIVIEMGVMLAEVVMALAALNDFDGEHLLQSAESLAMVLGVLGALFAEFAVAGKFDVSGWDIAEMAAAFDGMAFFISGMIVAMGKIASLNGVEESFNKGLDILQKITGSDMLGTWATLMGMFTAFAVAGKFHVDPAAVGEATVAFDAMVGLITVMLGALGGIANGLDWLNGKLGGSGSFLETLDTGIEMLKKVGEAIGGFVGALAGSFVGGIAEGFVSTLPGIADNLSKFGEKIQGFTTSMAGIKDETLTGTKVLAETLITLTGASILDGIRKWLGFEGFEKFGENLKTLGEGISDYGEKVKGVKLNVITASSKAVEALAEIQNNLKPKGGIGVLWGNTGLDKFGENLKALGTALKDYGESLHGIKLTAIQSSVKAVDTFADLQNGLDNAGGLIGMLTGNQDLGMFGDGLVKLGTALKDYSESVNGIKLTAVQTSVRTINAFGDVQNGLDDAGGFFGLFSGNQDLKTFGNNLKRLGEGLKNYSDSIAGANWSNIDTSLTYLKKIVGTTKEIAGTSDDEVGHFVNQVETGLTGVIDVIEDKGQTVFDLGKKFVGLIGNGAVSAQPELQAITNEIADSQIATYLEKGAERVQAGGTSVQEIKSGIDQYRYLMSQSGTEMSSEQIEAFLGEQMARVEAGEVSVSDFSSGMSDMIPKLIPGVADDTVLAYVGGLLSGEITIKEAAGELGKATASGIEGARPYVESAADKLNVRGFVAGLKHDKQADYAAGEEVADAANKGAASAYGEFFNTGGYLGSGLAKGLRDSAREIQSASDYIANIPKDVTRRENKVKSPSKVFQEIGEYLVEGLAIGIQNDDAAVDASANMAQDVIDAFGAEATSNDMNDVVHFMARELGKKMGTTGATELVKSVKEVVSNLSSTAEKESKDNPPEMVGFAEGIKAIAPLAVNTARETANDMAEAAEKELAPERFEEMGENAVDATVDGVSSGKYAMEDAGDGLRERFEDGVLSDWWSYIETGEKMAEYIAQGIRNGESYVYDAGRSLSDVFNSSFDSGYDGYSGVVSELQNTMDEIDDLSFSVLNATAHDPLEEYNKNLEEAASLGIQNAVAHDPLEDYNKNLEEAASLGILNAIPQPPTEEAAAVGAGIIDGEVQGVEKNASKLIGMITAVSFAALGAAKNTLGIHSPSKEFEEIGEFVVWGFAKGLTEHMEQIRSAAKDLAGESLVAVGEAIDALDNEAGDWTFTPVIRPVVDWSNMEQLGRMEPLLTPQRTIDLTNRASIEMSYARDNQNDAVAAAIDRLNSQMVSVESAVEQLNGIVTGGALGRSIGGAVRESMNGVSVLMGHRQVGQMVSDYQGNMARRSGK